MFFSRMPLSVPLLILIFSSGVAAQDSWGVTYIPTVICALQQSTVTMGCSYSYPSGYTVQTVFWTLSSRTNFPKLSENPGYRGRVQYVGNKQHDCSLRLTDVKENDQTKYYFRFETSNPTNQWLGAAGVPLSVTGLQVEGSLRVTEIENITLTCKTTCNLTGSPNYTWYRNETYISSSSDQRYRWLVSREDAGRYRCGVLGQTLRSPEVTLVVLYPPKNVSVSIRPSGEIVEGSSVTLTCSSDGNPPVEYNWFIGSSLVATGKTFTLNNISSVNSGGYKCRSSNELGEKYSDNVTLNVLYPPKNISVSISPSGEIVEGISVNLTCSSDGNPAVQYFWYKETLLVETGETFTMNRISPVNSGEYQCRSSNKLGEKYSDNVTLNVLYPPKSTSVSLSSSGKIVEGSPVNLTCSSDGNPPVQNYTWFKNGGRSPVGSGDRYTAVQSGSYYCVAQNKYGSQTAAAVPVTLGSTNTVLYAALGGAIGCGFFFIVVAVVCVRRKMVKDADKAVDQKLQEHIYNNVAVISAASKATPDLSNQDEIHYASIQHPLKAGNTAVNVFSPETDEKVEYASVQHRRDEVVEQTEDGLQYASLKFLQSGAPDRSAESSREDPTVIYSSVN